MRQDATISILKDIKQDTKHIPTMHKEIEDLKTKYEHIEKEVLNIHA